MTRKLICVMLLGVSAAAFAQIATGQTPGPAFEVASIRPAKPFARAVSDGSLIGMAIDPDRVRIGQMPIAKLIAIAYGVKRDQLVLPDWLDDDFRMFDIEAKLPAGATADQVPLMLQALLADRFRLTIRRASHEVDTYALLVGKDGLKIPKKEAVAEPGGQFTSQSRVISVTEGQKNGMTLDTGAYKMTNVPAVVTRVETSTIAGLVEYLTSGTSGVGAPVIDKTDVKGNFDIKLEVQLAELSSALRAGAPPAPTPGDPEAARAYLAALTEFMDEQGDARRKPVVAALDKLGLRLEKQKNPIETITVEHVEKNPTEN